MNAKSNPAEVMGFDSAISALTLKPDDKMGFQPVNMQTGGHIVDVSYGSAAQFVLSAYHRIKQNKESHKVYLDAVREIKTLYDYKELTLTEVLQEECNLILKRFSNDAKNTKQNKRGFYRLDDQVVYPEDHVRVAPPSIKALMENLSSGNFSTVFAAYRYDI